MISEDSLPLVLRIEQFDSGSSSAGPSAPSTESACFVYVCVCVRPNIGERKSILDVALR